MIGVPGFVWGGRRGLEGWEVRVDMLAVKQSLPGMGQPGCLRSF